MKTLTRTGVGRMASNQQNTIVGGSGSGGGGGSVDYAENAGHATTADEAQEAQHAVSAQTIDQNSPLWNKFLRKDVADTAAEIITFAKGIVSTLVPKFKAGILVGPLDQFGIDANGDTTVRDISTRTISADGNVTANGNVTATVNMTAAQMIANVFKNPDFVAAVNMIGKGFGVSVDNDGKATLQTDNLLVLGRMIVNALNIREVTYIGGTYFLTGASSEVVRVSKLYANNNPSDSRYWQGGGSILVGYRLMWKADDNTTATMNYWKQGDMALCQTFNITEPGEYESASNRYYKRLVARVGQVTISGETFHYADLANISTVNLWDDQGNQLQTDAGSYDFVGYDQSVWLSIPAEGDKIVQCGSQCDTTRQGAIVISAEGEASIGIYDGINNYSALSNFEIHWLSKTAVRMNAAKFYWRSGSSLVSQASIQVKQDNINMSVGTLNITMQNGLTINYDFWEQGGGHTIRNASWEAGYWLTNGTAAASDYRIRSSVNVQGAPETPNGFLLYDMDGGASIEMFEINNTTAATPKVYGLRYTPPTLFATPESWSVKAHILSYKKQADGTWAFDKHAEEYTANGGLVTICPSNGTIRLKVYFVATGEKIGLDPVSTIEKLCPYLCTAELKDSMITMTSDQLSLMVQRCGINIQNRTIDLIADKVHFLMPDGSTNAKVSIDPATGALNAVDGNFEGTVRANNLFIMVSVSSGSGPSVNDRAECVTMIDDNTNVTWVYVLNDIPASAYGHAFTAGHYLTGQEIDALVDQASQFCWKDDTTNFRICTGPSTQVMLVNKANADYSGYTFIPRCQDVPGKTIEIRNNTTNHSDAEIQQVDLAQNVFASGAYISDADGDSYNELAYGSTTEYHDSVPMGGTLVLYSTGTVWLRLRRTNN